MYPIRSLLFAPANRLDFLKKFPKYQADAYVIDLEDGTPAAEKSSARRNLPAAISSLREQNLQGLLFVRTNQTSSPYFEDDLAVVLGTMIDGVMIPKLETVGDLRRVDAALKETEDRTGRVLGLIGMIETPQGVVNVETLAGVADSHLQTLAFGAEDFLTGMGGCRTDHGTEVLYARSRVVLAARAFGLSALDQVFVNVRDLEGFSRQAKAAREMGYAGKMCVFPKQVEVANKIFSPSPDEIDRSVRLLQAFETAEASGHATFEFEGEMVDEPVLKRAQAVVRRGTHTGH